MHGYAQKLDEKSELINKNMSVVKKIAYYYLGRVHQVVEVEDLLQIGMVGLIEAAHNYEPLLSAQPYLSEVGLRPLQPGAPVLGNSTQSF